MASNLGFELIDLPFADEAERRELLRYAVAIYRYKGTLNGVRTLLLILGFEFTLTEVFSPGAQFICNFNRVFDRSLIATPVFTTDDFSSGNLSPWNPPLNTTSWWRIETAALHATGNGADDPLNALLFTDATAACRFTVEYTPDVALDSPSELGLYLRYQDADNWVRLQYQVYMSYEILALVKKTAGAETGVTLLTVDLGDLGANTGTHTLWVWDDGADNYTIGIDDQTLVAAYAFACTGIARGKKGLWVNRDRTIAFSEVSVDTHTWADMGGLFDPDLSVRKLQIELNDPAGEHTAAKKEYLERILPNYVPAGVEVEWI
jgi:hypothetical protein